MDGSTPRNGRLSCAETVPFFAEPPGQESPDDPGWRSIDSKTAPLTCVPAALVSKTAPFPGDFQAMDLRQTMAVFAKPPALDEAAEQVARAASERDRELQRARANVVQLECDTAFP